MVMDYKIARNMDAELNLDNLFSKKLKGNESYWQQGCNDGNIGLPVDDTKIDAAGYLNGWLHATGQPTPHITIVKYRGPTYSDNGRIISISSSEYSELQDASETLSALIRAGVHYWEEYDNVMQQVLKDR